MGSISAMVVGPEAAPVAAALDVKRCRAFVRSWLAMPASESHMHVRDPKALADKVGVLLRDGPSQLHVIADFDMTMTKYSANGKRGLSSHEVVNTGPAATPELRTASQAVHAKFYPLEIDPHISHEEKYQLMETWWRESHSLIVAAGMCRSDLRVMAEADLLTWRPGLRNLVDTTADLDMPFTVFSAGIGDLIQEVLRHANLLQPHVYVFSNQMLFDENDKIVGFSEPVIHTLNKSEILVTARSVDKGSAKRHMEAIRKRSNVILLGDSIGDARMADHVSHEKVLRIGFCNHNPEAWLDKYAKAFDIVVLDDAGFDWVLELLSLMRNAHSN